MKPLATLQRIKSITPIEGRDFISSAEILGWKTVVKKGEFNEGDLAVFIPIDTILPEIPYFEFMRKHHFRVKTMRLGGALSQGLCIPMDLLRSLISEGSETLQEGDDVTDIIGIKKYEKPIDQSLAGLIKGPFPSFLKITDELNLRTYSAALEEFKGQEVVITLKMDGTSVTNYLNQGVFGICGRRQEFCLDENQSFWRLCRKYKIEEFLRSTGRNIAVQGECFGPNINKNKVGAKELDFMVFNAFDIDKYEYISLEELKNIAGEFPFHIVPIVYTGVFNFSLQELIDLSNKQKYDSGLCAEGIVVRTQKEQRSKIMDGRLSGKIISELFSAKYGE